MSFIFCWVRWFWGLLIFGFFFRQFFEILRWVWVFLDFFLVLGKYFRLLVDRVERGCFFIVGNDFILKIFLFQGFRFLVFLFGRVVWSRSRYLFRLQEVILDFFFFRVGQSGLLVCGVGRGRGFCLGCWQEFFVFCVCVFLFGNNLQFVFFWNFNSVININGLVLFREGKCLQGRVLGVLGSFCFRVFFLYLDCYIVWNFFISIQFFWVKYWFCQSFFYV